MTIKKPVSRPEKRWGMVYFSVTTAGITVFCVFASTPNLWVGYSSITAMALFMLASVSLLFSKDFSPMRKIVGAFLGIVALTLAARAWDGLLSGNELALMSRSPIQTLTFATSFLLLIVAGTVSRAGSHSCYRFREEEIYWNKSAR